MAYLRSLSWASPPSFQRYVASGQMGVASRFARARVATGPHVGPSRSAPSRTGSHRGRSQKPRSLDRIGGGRGPAAHDSSDNTRGRGEMTRAPIDLQELRRRTHGTAGGRRSSTLDSPMTWWLAQSDGTETAPRGARQTASRGERGQDSDRGPDEGGELRIPGV